MIVPTPPCVEVPKLLQPPKVSHGRRLIPPGFAQWHFMKFLDAIAPITTKIGILQRIWVSAKGAKPCSADISVLHSAEVVHFHCES
jgi:hypothetical protein